MLGPLLILGACLLWAVDAVFRLPLARLPESVLDSTTLVWLEHVICVVGALPGFFACYREEKLVRGQTRLSLIFVGVIGSAIATIFFTAAFRYLNPSVAILLQKLQPLFAIAGARVFLGERPKRSFFLWASLAILGSILVSVPELSGPSGALHAQGIALALLAAVGWALSTVFGKIATRHVSFPMVTFFRFYYALVALSLFQGYRTVTGSFHWSATQILLETDPSVIRALTYLGLVTGVMAMSLYYMGLKRSTASIATIAELGFPVAAVAVNWIWLHQALTGVQILGAILVIVAIGFTNRGNTP